MHPSKDPARKRKKLHEWPESDRVAWERAIRVGHLRLRRGLAAKWREPTRRKVISAYGRYLTFLERRDWLSDAQGPGERVTIERIEAYLSELQEQDVAPLTVRGLILDLAELLRVTAPGFDGKWLYDLQSDIAADAEPRRDKRPKLRHPQELVALGLRTIAQAPDRRYREKDHWLAEWRDGLMLAFLAARPLRLRSFTAIRLGIELRRTGADFELALGADALKTGGYYDASLPSAFTPLLERYIGEIRPALLRGRESDKLWVTTKGTDMTQYMVYIRLRELTLRELGVAINVHMLRDCMITAIASDDPANIMMGMAMLQHRSPGSMTKHYNQAKQVEAAGRCQTTIQDLRERYPLAQRSNKG
jgi:hypothetical protein